VGIQWLPHSGSPAWNNRRVVDHGGPHTAEKRFSRCFQLGEITETDVTTLLQSPRFLLIPRKPQLLSRIQISRTAHSTSCSCNDGLLRVSLPTMQPTTNRQKLVLAAFSDVGISTCLRATHQRPAESFVATLSRLVALSVCLIVRLLVNPSSPRT
jgi:hypothetical protein